MADLAYGVTKVHGFTATGYESLTSNFEFITITTGIDIRTVAQGGTDDSQAALDKLIQIVSLRGQPVIMGAVGGSGPYTLILGIEHPSAWACAATADSDPAFDDDPPNEPWPDARANEDLKTRIQLDGVNYGFGSDGSLAVAFSAILT